MGQLPSETLQFSSRGGIGSITKFTGFSLLACGLFVSLLPFEETVKSSVGADVVFGVSGGLVAALGVLLLMNAYRKTRLSGNVLRIPKPVGAATIPADTISRVGMVWIEQMTSRMPSTWTAVVATTSGATTLINNLTFTPKTLVKKGDRTGKRSRLVMKGYVDPVASTTNDQLATSPAGSAVLALDRAVRQIQGPNGPLATASGPIPATAGERNFRKAYWLPDGTLKSY